MERIEVAGMVYEFEDELFLMTLLDENADRVYEGVASKPLNDPLTLNQLRKMDGEPVWVEHYNGGEWVIVSWNIYDEISYTQKARLSSDNYGLSNSPGWIAYRRKPEEGVITAQ